jgi:glycosyltransferase involved in cell wall biosynthesis
VSTIAPFIQRGGGRQIVHWLVDELRARGYDADTLLIPFYAAPDMVAEQLLSMRLIDLTGEADRVICIRSPSYLVRHPDKRLWFIHHERGAYDLWGTPWQNPPDTPAGRAIRRMIVTADDIAFAEAQRIYANSDVVAERLRRFSGITAEVLRPPLDDPNRFYSGPPGRYVFYPSRITTAKRQGLLVDAMAHVRSDASAVIAGHPDVEYLGRDLESHVRRAASPRIELRSQWISEDEKAELYANCLGVICVPYDEDSCSYVTMEAFAASKPVITCTDSGGTLELVVDGRNGFIAEPEPEALAEAIDRLAADPAQATEMGRRGHQDLNAWDVSWDRVIEALVR